MHGLKPVPRMGNKPDFRQDAVAASEALLAQHGQAADTSFCLRNEGGQEVFRGVKRRLLTLAVLGIIGILIGGMIALWLKFAGATSESDEWRKLAIAGAFSVSGFVLLFTQLKMFRGIVRNHVRARLEAAGENLDSLSGIHVTLENAATADVAKILPEDAGLLFLQPQDRSVRIEGLTHRYYIRADDVMDVLLSGGQVQHSSPRVRIAYRIGNATSLDISLAVDSTMKQVGYSLSGKAPALFDQVRACLRKKESPGSAPELGDPLDQFDQTT